MGDRTLEYDIGFFLLIGGADVICLLDFNIKNRYPIQEDEQVPLGRKKNTDTRYGRDFFFNYTTS